MYFLFFYCHVTHRHLHSFPTRRSSDLKYWLGYYYYIGAEDRSEGEEGVNAVPEDNTAALLWLGRLILRYRDRKSTRLNSSHLGISYAVFCLKKKKKTF